MWRSPVGPRGSYARWVRRLHLRSGAFAIIERAAFEETGRMVLLAFGVSRRGNLKRTLAAYFQHTPGLRLLRPSSVLVAVRFTHPRSPVLR